MNDTGFCSAGNASAPHRYLDADYLTLPFFDDRHRAVAARLQSLRDQGVRHLALVIGGADGLDESLMTKAHERLAFGPQTWPHALVRAMLAEQVYRAVSILAGSPYHRD